MIFPKVQLITLKETPEREDRAIKHLHKLGLSFRVHRFDKHPEIGWKGCIDSHLRVYQYAADMKMEWVFVCEDNIMANEDELPREKYTNLFKFISSSPSWGIVFTGGYILRPWDYCSETPYPQVYETRNNNHGTVSYIIHSRLYNKIIEMHKRDPIREHFDIFISRFTCYIYNPLLFYHAHDIVSNINRKSDVWRRFWFHPTMMNIHSYVFFNRRLALIIIAAVLAVILLMFRIR